MAKDNPERYVAVYSGGCDQAACSAFECPASAAQFDTPAASRTQPLHTVSGPGEPRNTASTSPPHGRVDVVTGLRGTPFLPFDDELVRTRLHINFLNEILYS